MSFDYTATYSPDDNKLRIYSLGRIPEEMYLRLRQAGFIWAPKQQLMVAPMWSPEREDVMLELAGEISDEDTTLVERAEGRADRFSDYSSRRQSEANGVHTTAMAIAERIPFGQPILIGHHSESRARNDHQRIHNGITKSVRLWERSEYWSQRAAGAIASAKYKELPAVRHRRIKSIEADLRKVTKTLEKASASLKSWLDVESFNQNHPESAEARDMAFRTIFQHDSHIRIPESDNRSTVGQDTILDALEWQEKPVTVAQVCQWAKEAFSWLSDPNNGLLRWQRHYERRLIYERAMLAESGGIAADRWAIEPGGLIKNRGTWLVVKRINRDKSGRICTLSIIEDGSRYFMPTIDIEKVDDYRPPTPDMIQKAHIANKTPPLVNFQGDGFRSITKAEFQQTRGSAAIEVISATEDHDAYRQRHLIRGGNYIPVFISDLKITERPKRTI